MRSTDLALPGCLLPSARLSGAASRRAGRGRLGAGGDDGTSLRRGRQPTGRLRSNLRWAPATLRCFTASEKGGGPRTDAAAPGRPPPSQREKGSPPPRPLVCLPATTPARWRRGSAEGSGARRSPPRRSAACSGGKEGRRLAAGAPLPHDTSVLEVRTKEKPPGKPLQQQQQLWQMCQHLQTGLVMLSGL